MVKIWRNRIEAGTQMLSHCPKKYRAGVVALIQEDLENGSYTKAELQTLVEDEMMTKTEYEEITGEPYPIDEEKAE